MSGDPVDVVFVCCCGGSREKIKVENADWSDVEKWFLSGSFKLIVFCLVNKFSCYKMDEKRGEMYCDPFGVIFIERPQN